MNRLRACKPRPPRCAARPAGRIAGLLLLLCALAVQAHDARPVAVGLDEVQPGIYQLDLRVPPTVTADNLPALIWPAYCSALPGGGTVLMRCAGGLGGQALALDFPLYNPSLSTFYRVRTLDGNDTAALVPPATLTWTVPPAMTAGQVARDYLVLGVEHIIGGLDHLLFVLGLLVIARTPQRILLTVTGFTLAHSITLSLSSLGLLAVPIAPVEAVIALSILLLAHEIARGRQDSLTWRHPLLVSFGFGLLHGLGFASALGEIGLVRNEVVVSLLFFNLGVELGQILFIAAVLSLVAILQKLPQLAQRRAPATGGFADLAVAYLIGVPSAFWVIERVWGLA